MAMLASYDIIFMDCQMPIMDGYEATKVIRATNTCPNQSVPIIALTANAMKGASDKCLAAGMNGYLTKPLGKDDLIQALTQYCKINKQRQFQFGIISNISKCSLILDNTNNQDILIFDSFCFNRQPTIVATSTNKPNNTKINLVYVNEQAETEQQILGFKSYAICLFKISHMASKLGR